MRTRAFLIRMVWVAAVISAEFITSCAGDEPQFGQEAAYAKEESEIDAYYADADDMAGMAVAGADETEGGRTGSEARELEIKDGRFCTVSVLLDVEQTLILKMPVGKITLDFTSGCTDVAGNIRKGKILVNFKGARFRPGSITSIVFENYEINGMKLNGVRTLTYLPNSTLIKPQFQVQLENGSVEWNGKTATREHCFVGTWNRGNLLNAEDDVLQMSACSGWAAQGINRAGVSYQMLIEQELVYKRGCPMAVSGIKRFVEVNSGKEIIIDYGSGTCDAVFTITVNGNIRNVRR